MKETYLKADWVLVTWTVMGSQIQSQAAGPARLSAREEADELDRDSDRQTGGRREWRGETDGKVNFYQGCKRLQHQVRVREGWCLLP